MELIEIAETSGGSSNAPRVKKATKALRAKKATENKTDASATSSKPAPASTLPAKLTLQQIVELLKGFWEELLQNNLRQVKKIVLANRASVDFRVAKYAPASDGSALHLCAQHGFLTMARLLFDELKVVDVDVQNKVGSTPLHVASKFGQDDMIYFLLERNARLDIPDNQHRIAFDVAPFAVVDRCILAHMREEHRNAQQINDELCAEEAAALAELEEAERENRNAEMELADAESLAFVEQELLCATQALDREWSNRLQIARTEMHRHREEHRVHQQILEEARESIDNTREKLRAEVERDRALAQERLDRAQIYLAETTSVLKTEQQALDNQLGLFDAARILSTDPVVQEWVLTTIAALVKTNRKCVTDRSGLILSARFLVRGEFVTVVSNVLGQFPTSRHLLWRAMENIVAVLDHTLTMTQFVPAAIDVHVLQWLMESFLRSQKPIKSILTQCRDAIERFSDDVDLNMLFARICYLLLCRLRHDNGSQSSLVAVKFSQEKRNQCLPLEMLRLFEKSGAAKGSMHTAELVEALRDAAFLLFIVAKSNVTKPLLVGEVVSTVMLWIRRLTLFHLSSESTSNDLKRFHETKSSASQLFLGALSFVHSVSWFATSSQSVLTRSGRTEDAAPSNLKRLEDIYPWTPEDVHAILSTARDSLSDVRVQTGSEGRLLIGFWMLKLLRNLALHPGEAAHMVRIELFDPSIFASLRHVVMELVHLSETTNCNDDAKSHSGAHDYLTRDAVIGVWLDLIESVWIHHFNSDGQLRATAEFVLDHLATLVTWQSDRFRLSHRYSCCLQAYSRTLCTLSLVLSNGKNVGKFRELSQTFDKDVQLFLRWLISLQPTTESTMYGVSKEVFEAASVYCSTEVPSSVIFESLVHVLRIYLVLLMDQRETEALTSQKLHDRCREVGICAVLRAFHLLDADEADSTPRNGTSELFIVGSMRSLQGMRATRFAKAPTKSKESRCATTTTFELQTLSTLSRFIVKLVGCKC